MTTFDHITLILFVLFLTVLVYDVWKRRHRHVRVSLTRGFTRYEVSGASVKDAMSALAEMTTLTLPEQEQK